ncbi:MAG: hypothetical protein GY796_12495 [Chloroflexi bacterium]|nr:hypothetical protein [Chloroflexota bacterium]
MTFPTIFDWLERFDFLRGYPAALAVLMSAVVVLLAWEWRVALFALAAQYLFVTLLYVDVLDPRLTVVKALVGWFVCLMLAITAGQVSWGRLPEDVLPDEVAQVAAERKWRLGPLAVPAALPLRLAAVLILLLVVIALTQQPDSGLLLLGEMDSSFRLAVYGLMGLGLLGLAVSDEPFLAGLGLLLFLSGFELFYSVLEQSVLMLAVLAAVNLLVALMIAYLVQKRYAIPALLD